MIESRRRRLRSILRKTSSIALPEGVKRTSPRRSGAFSGRGEGERQPRRGKRYCDEGGAEIERPLGLHEQRWATCSQCSRIGASEVVALGCGEGKNFCADLLADPQFESMLGIDVVLCVRWR